MANVCQEKGLSAEDVWPPFEAMHKWLNEKH